jgi:phosphatidylinositol-3-phosphatase
MVRAGSPHPTPPKHLIVVIEENHSLSQVIGSPDAPFVNRLAARGTLLTAYHAITHPSLPNYVALLGGSTSGIGSDCQHCAISGPTLVDQLEARRIAWAAYLEGPPAMLHGPQAGHLLGECRPVHARHAGP